MFTLLILPFWCPFKKKETAWAVVAIELFLEAAFVLAANLTVF